MGTACPNCTVDVYSDDEDEGRVYEGSTTADDAGDWTFDGSPEGPNVTATATDAAGNTSEFSAPVEVAGGDAHAHADTYAHGHAGRHADARRAHPHPPVGPRLEQRHLERRLHPRRGLRLRGGQVRRRLSLRGRRPRALLPRPARHLQHERH